jgi:UDP:flavonoid glycosyltransferase YjiC (YdhE family)
MKKKILFISGAVGLGHVVRDVEIARELRSQIPEVEVIWLAGEPARTFLLEYGETLHPKTYKWSEETDIIENVSKESNKKEKFFYTNVLRYIYNSRNAWKSNVKVFDDILRNEKFDLVMGDETYEIVVAIRDNIISIKPTFVMFYDFVGVDVMTNSLLDKLIAYNINFGWGKKFQKVPDEVITRIFIGELDDVPDIQFGLFLPNRREVANKRSHFVGYILPFHPDDYNQKEKIRDKLDYGNEPLIICTIGGTSIGLPLLELCCKTFPLLKEKVPDVKMLLVTGPRIKPEEINAPEGVIIKGYLPRLYEHLAACDLAIVQAGSTTTLELVALKKPFIYFSIEGHFEQQLHVSPRLERFNAGIKMQFSQTTPELLAEKVISNIGKKVNYPSIPIDRAKKTVKIIKHILEE